MKHGIICPVSTGKSFGSAFPQTHNIIKGDRTPRPDNKPV